MNNDKKNSNSSCVEAKTRSINEWLFATLLLVTSVSVFVPLLPAMPAAGIDPSWVLGMNQAISQGLKIGQDIIFTFGPYASIYTQSFHPATDGMMLWGSLYFGLSFCLVAFLNFKNSNWYLQLAFLITFLGISYSRDSLLYYYPLLVGAYIFKMNAAASQYDYGSIKGYVLLVALIFPFGLLPLIKGSLLVICVAVSALLFLFYILKRDSKRAMLICITPFVALIFFWVVAKQTPDFLLSYILSDLQFISGYTEAMSVAGNIWEVFFYVIGAVFLLVIIFSEINAKISDRVILTAIFAVILFIGLKGGFVRHDAHAVMAGAIILLTALLVNSFSHTDRAGFALLVAAFICIYINSNYILPNSRNLLATIEATYTNAFEGLSSRISGRRKLVQNFENKIASIHKKSGFPSLNGTVDIYSYDQSYLIASGGKWDPRPIFQSYAAYTPMFAKKNRDHLQEPNRPDNLILKVQPIDGRIPSMEDGASWPVILADYEPNALVHGFLFLKRRATNIDTHKIILSRKKYSFGDVVYLPRSARKIFVKIDIRPSFLGKVANALFKPSQLIITMNMMNGAIFHYRIIPEMAQTGFLLSPLVTNANEFGLLYAKSSYLESKDVKSISISDMGGKIFWNQKYQIEFISYDFPSDPNILDLYKFSKPKLRDSGLQTSSVIKCRGNIDMVDGVSPAPINFRVKSLLEVNGWLATSTNIGTLPESVYLVLFGQTGHMYFIDTEHAFRPDVGTYFKNSKLDASGFSAAADVSQLSGYYGLGLAYKENGEFKLCPKFNIRAGINIRPQP